MTNQRIRKIPKTVIFAQFVLSVYSLSYSPDLLSGFPAIPGTHLGGPHVCPADLWPLGCNSQKSLLQTQETCRGAGHQVVSDNKVSLFFLFILTAARKQPLQTGIKGASEYSLSPLQRTRDGPL